MSFQSMLDKKCNIHKVKQANGTGNYGLPSQEVFSYSETPDFTDIQCSYVITKGSVSRFESAGPVVSLDTKFFFLSGTNVALGDVLNCDGKYYRLDNPKDVRGHHIEVLASAYEVIFNG